MAFPYAPVKSSSNSCERLPPAGQAVQTHPRSPRFWPRIQLRKRSSRAPRSIPTSYAAQPYFAITAFKFMNADGQSRFGRFRLRPESTEAPLTPDQAVTKSEKFLADEMAARLAKGPVVFRVLVQLAESADNVADSTALWPETRTEAEFGKLMITQRVDELAPERHKIIFDPLPRVDGIDSAGDPLTDLLGHLSSERPTKEACMIG